MSASDRELATKYAKECDNLRDRVAVLEADKAHLQSVVEDRDAEFDEVEKRVRAMTQASNERAIEVDTAVIP